MIDVSHARLVLGVACSGDDQSVLSFIRFFDRAGVTGVKESRHTESFIEVFKHVRPSATDEGKVVEKIFGGITILATGNSDISCDFHAVESARRMFSAAVSEYKSFLNKSKINDTFSLEPRLILIGERVSHYG